MQICLLKSKIHRAIITFQNLNYEGSLSVDRDLMDAAGIYPHERLLLANTTNGERLETYAIEAPRGSGTIGLNGAAARRGMEGDSITIMSFGFCSEQEAASFHPRIIVLDEKQNEIVKRSHEN